MVFLKGLKMHMGLTEKQNQTTNKSKTCNFR